MVDRMPWAITAAGADGEKAAPAARPRPGRHLIAMMLLAAAVLDLTRCGLVLAAARHPAPTAGLAAAGLAAAVLSVRTARGCQAGRGWAGWAALPIGVASAPQAAMSGFHGPYTIPGYGHRRRGGSAGRGCPGHRRWGRATGPVHRKPVHHRQGEPPGDPQRTPARSNPPYPRLPPHTGLIGNAGGAGVLSQALHPVQRAGVRGAADRWWGRRPELVTAGEKERWIEPQLVKTGAGKLGGVGR